MPNDEIRMSNNLKRLHWFRHVASFRIRPPDVLFEFVAKLANRVFHRPGGAVGQARAHAAGHARKRLVAGARHGVDGALVDDEVEARAGAHAVGAAGQLRRVGDGIAHAHVAKGAALELAPDVRVNGLALGFIRSELVEDVFSAERIAAVVDQTPLARLGEFEEVTAAVKFLASDASSFITGQTIVIDGGRIMR